MHSHYTKLCDANMVVDTKLRGPLQVSTWSARVWGTIGAAGFFIELLRVEAANPITQPCRKDKNDGLLPGSTPWPSATSLSSARQE